MVKVDGAIDDGVAWVAWVLEVGDLQQYLTDAPGALLRHGDHDEYHREHHEAHEHRDTIGDNFRAARWRFWPPKHPMRKYTGMSIASKQR